MAIVRKSGREIEWISSEAEVVEHWHFVSRFVATDASQNMVMVVLYEIGRENISRGLFGPPTELPTPRWSVFVPPAFFSNSSRPKSDFRRRTNIINWDYSSDTVVKSCLYKPTVHTPCT